ncbi:hypothetical protein KIH13_17500 [Pseudomonas viridiflava]|nr:hypothetical protein KIH13_17500 [Pseudomonas viridiflava]
MKSTRLNDMVRGWFVGGFTPSAYSTEACEVGVKCYKAGEKESSHKHLIATEITVVLRGIIRMGAHRWRTGDIIILAPGEITDFEAITNCSTVVVKVPGALGDKYLT